MNELPLISAISWTNGASAARLTRLVDEFKRQTYSNKELIILNTADDHWGVTEFNPRAEQDVFVMDLPNVTCGSVARNYGLSAANGPIIALFDPTHYHHPERLSSQIRAMASGSAHMCGLSACLAYSFTSGYGCVEENQAGIILESLMFQRPSGLDFGQHLAGELVYFFDQLCAAKYAAVTLAAKKLMIHLTGDQDLRACTLEPPAVSAPSIPELQDALIHFDRTGRWPQNVD